MTPNSHLFTALFMFAMASFHLTLGIYNLVKALR